MDGPAESSPDPYAALGRERIALAPDAPPILLTVVSTEEEFDWSRPFDREANSVASAPGIRFAQAAFDDHGVRPCYVVDFPIASRETSVAVLADIHRAGKCEIGAHLHPWVSPPFEEVVSERHSYPGNLPGALELAKLQRLTQAIELAFGVKPAAYQAGRYGFGPRTAAHLTSLGYAIDLSASPPFDFRPDGGPDYSRLLPEPFWTNGRELLVVPITGAFIGCLSGSAPSIHRWSQRFPIRATKLAAVLARARAIERLRLSPEGFTLNDMKRLTAALMRRGTRVFALSLHSPSFTPGHTPYVRTLAERDRLLDACRGYFAHFFGELGGRSMTPAELRQHLLRSQSQGVAAR